jgi:sensor histidine kinase YesM
MSAAALPIQKARPERWGAARAFISAHWRTGLLLLAVWTFFALLFTPQSYLLERQRDIRRALAESLIAFYPWIVISPFVLWISGRFPLLRGTWMRNGAIQLLFGVPVCLLHVIVIRVLFRAFGLTQQLAPFHMTLLVAGAFDLFVYCAILATGQGVRYYRESQERQYRLSQAQLQMLRGQLQPHFLFNTLHAVTELVYCQPETADRVITSLSDLLRLSLHDTPAEVPLNEDLQFVYKYMEIQKELLRERLTVEYAVDPRAMNVAVPSMMLQPLLENAVKHGVSECASGGSVRLSARRDGGYLLLEVFDTGAGSNSPTAAPTGGIGLANTRARLQQLYGDEHNFDASPGPSRGFCVSIKLPWRELSH